MIFKLTTKGCQVSDKSYRYITQHLEKIIQALPDTEDDLIVLRLVIKKNIDKYHPPRTRHHTHKTYADTKPALSFFEGSITFRLNKNQLFVRFKGSSIDECIDIGFGRIFKELKKHKDLHFPSESQYPNHRSIRGE